MTDELFTNDIIDMECAIFVATIKLRSASCRHFTTCDICPFCDDVDGEDEYQCKLEQSIRAQVNTMLGRD